jgi:hypothetical protein
MTRAAMRVAAIGIFEGHTISDPGRATFALQMRPQLCASSSA